MLALDADKSYRYEPIKMPNHNLHEMVNVACGRDLEFNLKSVVLWSMNSHVLWASCADLSGIDL